MRIMSTETPAAGTERSVAVEAMGASELVGMYETEIKK